MQIDDRYPAYTRLVAPARETSELWRLLFGILMVGAVMAGLGGVMNEVLRLVLSDDAFVDAIDGLSRGDTPWSMLGLLMSMGLVGVATVIVALLLHRRGLASLIGPLGLALWQFRVVGVAMVMLFAAVAALPPWDVYEGVKFGLPLGQWAVLLPFTLMALLVQVGSEEVLFRGYIQSQLAARFSDPTVWMLAPSALFAMGHYQPAIYAENAPYVVLWAFLFGVAAADITARAGSLGPAIALHLVNNFMALAVTAVEGPMSGLALFVFPFAAGDVDAVRALLPIDFAVLGLSWLGTRLALRV